MNTQYKIQVWAKESGWRDADLLVRNGKPARFDALFAAEEAIDRLVKQQNDAFLRDERSTASFRSDYRAVEVRG